MAILQCLLGVEVIVRVDEQALEEYNAVDKSDQFHTKTCYIEAKSHLTFEVVVVTKAGATRGAGLEYNISIDGEVSDEYVVSSSNGEHTYISKGWLIEPLCIQEYKFNELKIDETGADEQTHGLEHLGQIQVDVYHLSDVRDLPEEVTTLWNPATSRSFTEDAIKGKGLTHTVVQLLEKDHVVDVDYFTEEPIATFKFLYRSREALKQALIIPGTPPPPELEDRAAEPLPAEDVAELQKQLKAAKERMAAMEKIKQEEQDDNPRPRKAARPSGPTEVIELD